MDPDLDSEDVNTHDAAYAQGWRLAQPFLRAARHPAMPLWMVKNRLEKAKKLFEKALSINKEGWASMWALGKIHQRLTNHEAAFNWFMKARELQPGNIDVVREASVAALAVGRSKEAVELSRDALRMGPDDAGLMANHALALLIAGDPTEASLFARQALHLEPHDPISRKVDTIISAVVAGRRRIPDKITL